MNLRFAICTTSVIALLSVGDPGALALQEPSRQPTPTAASSCERIGTMPNLTITFAALKPATSAAPEHCYIQGTIAGRIRFHMQLPLPANWNGRLLNIGDGGKDGQLDFSDQRLAQGYAVANSNTGHDNGAEPRASFADHNLDAILDLDIAQSTSRLTRPRPSCGSTMAAPPPTPTSKAVRREAARA